MAKEAVALPVIDLADFPAELEKLAAASTELGCFRVINHGTPASLLAGMKETAGSLFGIPGEAKLRNVIHDLYDAGYMPMTSSHNFPFYESFGIYDAASPTDVLSFCSVLDASPQQRKIISDYFAKQHAVIVGVACKVAESLGLAGRSFKEWSCHGRLNSYKFKFQEDIGCIGVPIHTDSGFLTLLQEDERVGGLEIVGANGSFMPVDPLPGSLLVIIGDVGKVWSNGRLQNVKHRVVCKEAMPRISIALFLLAPQDGFVETEVAFIDADYPKLYPKFNYDEYRKQRVVSGLRAGEALPVFANADDHSAKKL